MHTDDIERYVNDVEQLKQCEAELRAEIRGIARLSRADGALILDSHFTPLRLASRLRAPTWSGDVIIGQGLYSEGLSFNRQAYGTRHNSAIDFVGAAPPSIAFVISSDGPIRVFAKQADVLTAWPDYFGMLISNS